MIALSPVAVAAIALICGAWLAVAVWATFRAGGRITLARNQVAALKRSGALLAASPATPLIVYRDGRLEGSERLAPLFGLQGEKLHLADLLAAVQEDGRQALEE